MLGLAGLLLAGCVDTMAERQAALQSLIGQNEATVVQSLGVPSRSYEVQGHTFLAFDQTETDYMPEGFDGGMGMGMGFGGFGGFDGGFEQPETFYCDTTVEIFKNVMQSFTIRGDGC